MFNKTFRTLNEYPKIYLGFAVSAAVTSLFALVGSIIASNISVPNTQLGLIGNDFIGQLYPQIFSLIGVSVLHIFLFPFLFLHIKKACLNVSSDEGFTFFYKDEINKDLDKGDSDYKSILKTNWYKIFVVNMLATVAVMILFFPYIILAVLTSSFGFITFVFVVSAAIVIFFAQIASVCVIIEDSFGEGLKCAFKYGKAIIFPLIGTSIVIGLPLLIIVFLESYVFETTINAYGILTNEFSSYLIGSKILMVVLVVFKFIYSIYRDSFIYTYIMQKYYSDKYERQTADDLSISFEGDANADISFDDIIANDDQA